MAENQEGNNGSSNEFEECPVGIHESVEVAVIGINLDSVCAKVALAQKWNTEKINAVEKTYRTMMTDLALALDGHAIVSGVGNDVGLVWEAHCEEGQKYAKDMLAIVRATNQFRGKSMEEKFPGPNH